MKQIKTITTLVCIILSQTVYGVSQFQHSESTSFSIGQEVGIYWPDTHLHGSHAIITSFTADEQVVVDVMPKFLGVIFPQSHLRKLYDVTISTISGETWKTMGFVIIDIINQYALSHGFPSRAIKLIFDGEELKDDQIIDQDLYAFLIVDLEQIDLSEAVCENQFGVLRAYKLADFDSLRQLISAKHLESLEVVLKGMNPEDISEILQKQDEVGDTLLHLASGGERGVEIVKLLLNYGADKYVCNFEDEFPFHYAEIKGDMESYDLLIIGIEEDEQDSCEENEEKTSDYEQFWQEETSESEKVWEEETTEKVFRKMKN